MIWRSPALSAKSGEAMAKPTISGGSSSWDSLAGAAPSVFQRGVSPV